MKKQYTKILPPLFKDFLILNKKNSIIYIQNKGNKKGKNDYEEHCC